ncbi:MAG: cell division protein [Helicobacteraceae bacterium]|nr:cell division protein [Helicobacteraceae bacterium]
MADRQLFVLTSMLIAIGILFSYSLSTYTVLLFGYNEFHYVLREAVFGFSSIIVIFLLAQLNPDKWLHVIGISLFIGGAILMITMPFMPNSLVSAVGGAKRWIKLFGFSLAPIEFFKIGFIYFLAWSFSRTMNVKHTMSLKDEFVLFAPYAFMFLGVMFLVAIMQNDLGQVVVLSLTLGFMLLLAGRSFKFFGSLLSVAVAFFLFFIFSAEHRILRIQSWWASAQQSILVIFPDFIAEKLRVPMNEEAYQIGHSFNAINNGGLFGVGLANGTFKLGFLSEVHTDFVLAGIAEEFGFLGVLFVTLLFMAIIWRIFKIANRAEEEDVTIFLFSIGLGLLLSFAFLINAYGISGLTPIKGISVPFLSYGGSTILASSIGIGMVLMASKKVKFRHRAKK